MTLINVNEDDYLWSSYAHAPIYNKGKKVGKTFGAIKNMLYLCISNEEERVRGREC